MEGEDGFLSRIALDLDCAVIFAADCIVGQAQAEPHTSTDLLRGEKGFEYALNVLGRDTGTVIGDGKANAIIFRPCCHGNDPLLLNGLIGVGQEMSEGLLQWEGLAHGQGQWGIVF